MQPLSEATKYIGRKKFLESVYLAAQNGDASAIAFWTIWQDLTPREQLYIPFDEIAVAAGVHANELMASAVNAAMILGARTSEMVYAAHAPMVVKQMLKSAQRIGGQHAQVAMLDRHKVLQHGGFLPSPHGQTITVNNTAQSDAKALAAAKTNEDPSVPSFLEDMDDLEPVKTTVHRGLLEATPQRIVETPDE